MHVYANPARFLKLARPLTAWLGWAGVALILASLAVGMFAAPPERYQGESVRILYIHVPAAWLAMGGWTGIAVASLMQLIWRHPLAAVAARGIAVPGATPCGSPIQRMRLSGLFSSRPPSITRLPMPSSVGPTRPRAAGTPVTLWQPPQP